MRTTNAPGGNWSGGSWMGAGVWNNLGGQQIRIGDLDIPVK